MWQPDGHEAGQGIGRGLSQINGALLQRYVLEIRYWQAWWPDG